MKRYPQTTYLIIFGFVAGSIVKYFRGSGRVDAASVPGTAGGRILPDPSVVAAGDEGMKGDQMNFVIRIATEKDIDELRCFTMP